MQITANAHREYSGRFFHNDTTTMNLQGEYEHEAKEVLENADMEKMRSTALNGYHIFTTEVEYAGVKQRWEWYSQRKRLRERRKRWRRR